jgi:hypothetical protein
VLVDLRARNVGKEIVVRACVGGGRQGGGRPMLAVNVRTRRRKLRPTAGLAVTNARVSSAGATAGAMGQAALPLRGPWRFVFK